MRLKGRAAIVTGAGRAGAIGEAIALRLALDGADVAVIDVCKTGGASEIFGQWEQLEGVADRVRATGRRALAVRADVTDEADVRAMVDRVMAEFGRVDILCNNAAAGRGAGPTERTPLVDVELADWRYTIEASLISVATCSKYAGRAMIAGGRGGAIVNTLSGAAFGGTPGLTAYAAAKLGVVALTRCMATEMAEHGVRVNAFAPGLTDTPWVRERVAVEVDEAGVSRDAFFGDWTDRVPLKRAARPEEMASVVAFLASDDASYITGDVLNVDGGLRPR
jgi:NAD(P)-dependent dehydrogenase (short-subunit alcohol dehydrogenase family)